jgi:hypothetical protein
LVSSYVTVVVNPSAEPKADEVGRPYVSIWRGKWGGIFENMTTPNMNILHPKDFFFNTSPETFELFFLFFII